MNKSAPCGCCGTLATCNHCSKLTVIIYSCEPAGAYAGQAIAGCVVHVKIGGVDVTGSPFTTTNSLNPDPQIVFDTAAAGSATVSFAYPSGSPFSAPSDFTPLNMDDCHTYFLKYTSALSSGNWSCDCCPGASVCCDSNGDPIPIYRGLDWSDGIESGTGTFIRSGSNAYWEVSSSTGVRYRMICDSGGNMRLDVHDFLENEFATAAPTTCDPFSVTFPSIDISGDTNDLLPDYQNEASPASSRTVIDFTASHTNSFGGAWSLTDNGVTAFPFCGGSCGGCVECEKRFPTLQMSDSTYGSTLTFPPGTLSVTNSSVSLQGLATCPAGTPPPLTSITTALTYVLSCGIISGVPTFSLNVRFWRCITHSEVLTTPTGTGKLLDDVFSSNTVALSLVDCRSPSLTFTMQSTSPNPLFAGGEQITFTTVGSANICMDCACILLDGHTTLSVGDPVYGGPVTITADALNGFWQGSIVHSGVTYTYRFTCGNRPTHTSERAFYLKVNISGVDYYSTNTYESVSDCANPSYTFSMPTGGSSYPSGGNITVGP